MKGVENTIRVQPLLALHPTQSFNQRGIVMMISNNESLNIAYRQREDDESNGGDVN